MNRNASNQNWIAPDKVNMKNYKEFLKQIQRDVLVGTSVEDVKEYLSRRNIAFGHVEIEGNIKVMIKKVDSKMFIFNKDLQVKIFLSDEKSVSQINSNIVEKMF